MCEDQTSKPETLFNGYKRKKKSGCPYPSRGRFGGQRIQREGEQALNLVSRGKRIDKKIGTVTGGTIVFIFVKGAAWGKRTNP